jgi:hypothetical protein
MTINKAKNDAIFTPEQAFNFTPDDLAENWEGRLSLRQHKNLTSVSLVTLMGWGMFTIVVLVGFIAAVSTYHPTVQVICAVGIAVFLGLPMLWQTVRLLTFPREVRSVTGSLFLNVKNSRYIAVIDDQWFNLNEVQYRSLRQERCTVYYSPRGKRIVSVEWLGEW